MDHEVLINYMKRFRVEVADNLMRMISKCLIESKSMGSKLVIAKSNYLRQQIDLFFSSN